MKKTTLRQVALKLCLVALVLLSPFGLRAQETLTVYDGTNTNSNIPFYGLYADYGTRSQFIIPASSLEDMAGASIEKITFYTSAASPTYDEGVTVYLKEVENTVFASAALEDWSTMTPVYVGSVTVSSNAWEIVFSDSYTYEGGNLMIGVQVTTWGSLCPSINWYGVSQTTGTYTAAYNNANSSHTWNTTINRVAFLPKTTFTYELTQQGGDVCEKPATCETSDVTATSATLSWTGGSGTYNVEVKGGQWSDWTAILTSTPLTSTTLTLQPATSYQARVQSVCTGSNPTSTWKTCSSFSTPCASYDIPYTYGFEESTPFACWTPITGVSIVDHTSTQPTHDGTAGSKHLRFASTTSNLVALPQFNEPTNNLRVEFWTRPENATNASCGTFSVGYMTDITDASTFVEVTNYAYNDWASTTYVKKAVDFVNVPSNANIAFRHNAGSSSWYWFVDDVTVKEMPSCVAPTALAANVSTTSAELSWTANSGETNWTLYYKKTTDENYTEVANATNPYTLNTLTAATNYQYYVVANCSSTDASEASEVFNFATECDAIVITTDGWTENFDSYTGVTSGTANNLPHCWNYINTSTYSSYKGYPVIYNASATSNSGNNHLRFYSYYSTYYDPQPQYAILPEMSNLDNNMRIKLQARGYNATSTFKIGRMTDPTDANTFVPFTIGEGEEQALTTAYQEFTYNITGSGDYLAIMIDAATSSRTTNGVYIDDIRVEPIPSCIEPSGLQFVSSTTTTATLQWTAGGSETAWDIYYSTENVAPTNSTEPLATATTNPATISNLTSATTYYAWVRANCSSSEQSPWIGGVSFNTACDAVTTFPWSEDFESYPAGNFSNPCWVNEHIAGSSTSNVFKVYTATNSTNNTHQLQLPDQSSGNMIKLVLPEMVLPNTNYQFVLDVYRSNSTYSPSDNPYEGIRIFASTTGDIEGATELAFIPRQYDEENGIIQAESVQGWYTYALPINMSGSCYIILRGESRYCTSTYMDNFMVTSCLPVGTLTSDNVASSSAELSWTLVDDNQTAWQVAYKADADADFTIVSDLATVHENYLLEGLTPETHYTVKVRAYCSTDDQGEWSNTVDFTTLASCPVPSALAATEVNGAAALSWTGYSDSYNVRYRTAATLGTPIFSEDFNSGIGDWTMQNCASETGVTNDAFRFKWNTNPPQYLISPEITGIDAESLIEFTYYNNSTTYEETFKVGLSSTTNAIEDFTWSETVAVMDYSQHTYHATVPAGTKYMAIQLLSDDKYYLYIDDIVIASAIPAGDWTTVTSGEAGTTVSGLAVGTDYEYQAQAVCGGTTSAWSDSYFFSLSPITRQVAANKWYAIASPVNSPAVADVNNLTNAANDLYGFDEAQGKWIRPANLANGMGYIYRRATAATVEFAGMVNSGNTDVAVTASCGDAALNGFNLLGNPFNHAISYSNYYSLNENGTWESHTSGVVGVAEAFLVHYGTATDITIEDVNAGSGAKSTPESPLAITVSNDSYEDVAYAMFSDGEGLPKIGHLTAEAPMLSIPVDGRKYAIANLGNDCGSFELNLNGENGTYTLSVAKSDLSSYYYLHLVDRATGADVDLLSQPVYTFTQTGGNAVTNRFLIKLTPGMDAEGAQGDFAYWNGSAWVVEGTGDLQVFDVLGRKIYTETLTTADTQLSNSIFRSTGVYILHLGEKSQKIVVK